jgi:hypothetical protein
MMTTRREPHRGHFRRLSKRASGKSRSRVQINVIDHTAAAAGRNTPAVGEGVAQGLDFHKEQIESKRR